MSNDIVLRPTMALTFDEMARAAKAMALSQLFDDAKDVSKAMVKVMAGAELGLGPFAAMTGIHVIKGKPVLGANLIATLIKNDPRYDYRVVRLDDEACVLDFYEDGEIVGPSSFTIEDAVRAGVGASQPPGKPGTMRAMFPRNMLFARAISNGARWYAPGIFGGAAVYTPNELDVDVDEDGYVLERADAPDVVDGEVVTFDELQSAKPVADVRAETSPAEQQKRAALRPTADDVPQKFHASIVARVPFFSTAADVQRAMDMLEFSYPADKAEAKLITAALERFAQLCADGMDDEAAAMKVDVELASTAEQYSAEAA